jgi:hypothetical protein
MSLTATQVDDLVASKFDSRQPWRLFHDELVNQEAVRLGPYGYAYLVEDLRPQADSYGYVDEGDASFVFRIEGGGEVAHFRKEGYLDSYEGLVFRGDLYEVSAKTVTVSRWERA